MTIRNVSPNNAWYESHFISLLVVICIQADKKYANNDLAMLFASSQYKQRLLSLTKLLKNFPIFWSELNRLKQIVLVMINKSNFLLG